MPIREQSDLPYRTALPQPKPSSAETSADEVRYDSLVRIGKLFEEQLEALKDDFNLFDVLNTAGASKTEGAYKLLLQIEARQIAYQLLAPAADAIRTAINKVDSNHKE